jgi:hypothetical protein
MLEDIFNFDRRLRIDYKKLLNHSSANKKLINTVNNYLKDYSDYYNLRPVEILQYYNDFSTRYYSDIKNFKLNGKYPFQLGLNNPINRISYNIFLILSIVVCIHRHRIMVNLIKYSEGMKGKILIIGLGSGVELEFLSAIDSCMEIDAYDINVDNFVKDRFNKIFNIKENKFMGKDGFYDYIIAIELLEHLEKPYDFLSMCYNSLNEKGYMVTTTATDVPQFDHLYNFKNDNEFDENIKAIGFTISAKENISHNYMIKNIDAKNTWCVLNKLF